MFNSTIIVNKKTTTKTRVEAVNSLSLFESFQKSKKAFFVIDENVYLKHENLVSFLDEEKTLVLKSGEENKTLSAVQTALTFFKEKNVDKSNLIYAVGGGVTGDTVGFACSVYMRGIEYVNVPTTLLSMCDSSVGGKTGVDFCGVKNLLGAFYPPIATLLPVDLVSDVTKPPFNDGIGEILKCSMLGNKKIFSMLKSKSFDLTELIIQTLKVKGKYVKKDFYDMGERKMLNLGHTFAHAIESISNFTISHGQAVGMGLVLAVKYSAKAGLIAKDFSDELKDVLSSYNLNPDCPYSLKELVPYMKQDKKADDEGIFMILPVARYKCEISYRTFKELESVNL